MTTLFDLLNTIHNNNNNNNNIYGGACKRTSSQCGTPSSNNNNSDTSRKTISIIPELDVTMSNEQLLIQVELAGVNKQDIEIDINDSILTIKGEKKNINKSEIKEATVEKDNTNDEPSIEEFEDDVKQQQTKQTTTSKTRSTSTSNTTSASQTPTSSTPATKTKPTKYIQERTFGYFKRHLDLTKLLHQLNLNSINTTFENGLLSITIDKKENCLNSIKILIN